MSLQEELNVRLQKQENSQSTLSAVDKGLLTLYVHNYRPLYIPR